MTMHTNSGFEARPIRLPLTPHAAAQKCREELTQLLAVKKLETTITLPSEGFTTRSSFVRFEIGFGDPGTTYSEPKLGLNTLKSILSGEIVGDIPVVLTPNDPSITPLVRSTTKPFPVLLRGIVPVANISSPLNDWLAFTGRNSGSQSERYITLSALHIRTLSLHRPTIAPESQYYASVLSQWDHACTTLREFLSKKDI